MDEFSVSNGFDPARADVTSEGAASTVDAASPAEGPSDSGASAPRGGGGGVHVFVGSVLPSETSVATPGTVGCGNWTKFTWSGNTWPCPDKLSLLISSFAESLFLVWSWMGSFSSFLGPFSLPFHPSSWELTSWPHSVFFHPSPSTLPQAQSLLHFSSFHLSSLLHLSPLDHASLFCRFSSTIWSI